MSIFDRIPRKDGPITKALHEAVRRRAELLKQGLDEFDVDREIGEKLKSVLGNPRQAPWRFLCERCRDTGWVLVDPSDEEMERLVRLYGPNPKYQDYAVRCDDSTCRYIMREREMRRTREQRELGESGVASAGRLPQKKQKFLR